MSTPATFHALEGLDVIGYATRLTPAMLPSIVAPVFRMRARQERLILPPYKLAAGMVCNGREIVSAEMDRLVAAGEVTSLLDASAAKEDHELWLDENGRHHYEPIAKVSGTMREIALQHIRAAKDALIRNDLQRSKIACKTAVCADDRLVDPFAIQAAIAQIEGNAAAGKLMRKFAETMVTPDCFQAMVDELVRMARTPAQRPSPTAARSIMTGIAVERPLHYSRAA